MQPSGIAQAASNSHKTTVGQVKGKIAYMAPEQLLGETIDRRVDVFGLGCVLYETTTGRKPFKGDTAPQVITVCAFPTERSTGVVRRFGPVTDAIYSVR